MPPPLCVAWSGGGWLGQLYTTRIEKKYTHWKKCIYIYRNRVKLKNDVTYLKWKIALITGEFGAIAGGKDRERDNERQRVEGCAWHGRFIFFHTTRHDPRGLDARCFNILIGRRNGRFRDLAFYNDILCLTFRSSERVKPCSSRKSTTRNNLFCSQSGLMNFRAFLPSWTKKEK